MADQQLDLGLEDAPPRRRRTAEPESFHIRSEVTPDEAVAGEAQAAKQEASILGYFRAFAGTSAGVGSPPGRWTPSEVHAMFPSWPITSVRRALSNLTRRGLLVHYPADRRPGPRGARESTWGLA